ncbi:pyridoxal phosphate-dependent aminotransferase [Halococcoides cellulosivorans]|uniref:histidinol-phosphate transaminase n=1 Tax=Halococcoides cellulosivorans TaxID=1679096 RepID=A0A2R4WYF8_9EURY|nr:histidinol-phosphate transaminase [Halococcoides cellulosivorans]AWB26556.1 threonine-phosphate decarboxylase [Halococcoides cellulosivorans]
MEPDALDDLCSAAEGRDATMEWDWRDRTRVGHGGERDCHWERDFSRTANPMTPDGVSRVFESSYPTSRQRPADDYCSFRAAAAQYLGVEPSQVVPTTGATGAIRLAIDATVEAGDSVVLARPSFAEYEREVRLQGAKPSFVAEDALLEVDPDPYALVIVAAPNNPTGWLPEDRRLARLVERCRDAETPIVIDETHLAFADRVSMAGHAGTIVVRSPSTTFGLPGLRAGFAVATGRLRDRLDAGRLPWAIGRPAEAAIVHCMDHPEFVSTSRRVVASERDRIRESLPDGVDAPPSSAPFVLLDLGDSAAVDRLLDVGRERGVAVRDARNFRGLDTHVRVAIRSPADNDALVETIAAALE